VVDPKNKFEAAFVMASQSRALFGLKDNTSDTPISYRLAAGQRNG